MLELTIASDYTDKKQKNHIVLVWQTLSCYCLKSFPQLGPKSLVWIINESQKDKKKRDVSDNTVISYFCIFKAAAHQLVTSANILLLNCFLTFCYSLYCVAPCAPRNSGKFNVKERKRERKKERKNERKKERERERKTERKKRKKERKY